MIDWAKVAELREDVGAEEFGDVVAVFLEEVDTTIAELRAGCRHDALENKLHFLKGSALNLGFVAFSIQCGQGESDAAAGRFDAVDLPATLDRYHTSRETFLAGLSRFDIA